MPIIVLKESLARGIALIHSGQMEQAEKMFRQLISAYPTHPDVLNLFGTVLLRRKRQREAADLFRMAIAVRGDVAEFHVNLASALQKLRGYDEAERALRRAIEIRPDVVRAHGVLGATLGGMGRLEESKDCYRRALELDPNDADAHTSLGICHFDTGEYEQAIAEHREALRLRPDFPMAHLNLALALLVLGREEEGLEEYEWRNKVEGLPKVNFRQPMWDGSPLNGRRLLMYTEQGLGDAIQFVRLAPIAAARGGPVTLITQNEIKSLLQTVGKEVTVLGRDVPLPGFDVYAPLLSLPRIFKVRTPDVPAEVPYLKADPDLASSWKERLAGSASDLRVGIAWAGSPFHRRDRERSIAAADLGPLLGVPNVTFYSLQKGPAALQLKACPELSRAIDFTEDLHTMADTAALIQNLDLVITVDTSICHLAGALARPVWVMVAKVPHWGWGLESETTPWYPTMRLFRQEAINDWSPVVAKINQALGDFAISRPKS